MHNRIPDRPSPNTVPLRKSPTLDRIDMLERRLDRTQYFLVIVLFGDLVIAVIYTVTSGGC